MTGALPRSLRPGRARRSLRAFRRTARGRAPRRGPAPHHRGRGHGQDHRAHPPHRAPHREQARPARGDPGPHLHREGRGRDGRARRPAHPLRLRRDAASPPSTPSATACCARPRSRWGSNPEFRVLTEPEQSSSCASGSSLCRSTASGRSAIPRATSRRSLTLVSRAKDEDVSPRQYRAWAEARLASGRATRTSERGRGRVARRARRLLRGAPAPARGGRARRLRRPDPPGAGCCASARGARPPARPPPLHPGRRVPGHEPRAARAAAALAGDAPNITVVGDDDQAIYRWRGAAAANLLAFRRLYPGAREVVLTENHRSTQLILDASSRLISYNNPYRLEVVARIDKRLRAQRPGGVPVRHLALRHRFGRGRRRGRPRSSERIQAGARPRDLAILVRSNGDADAFLRALNVKGIPHRFSGSRGLYAREEVRLLVSFLRVAREPRRLGLALLPLRFRGLPHARGRPPPASTSTRAGRRGRCSRSCARCPRTRTCVGVGGATREAAARLLADLDRARAEVPRRRTGRGALRLPPALGAPRPPGGRGDGGGRGQGQEHREVLRDP